MKIYLSYRRTDSAAVAGRLSDRLAAQFGPENVFKDTDAIPVGDDFRATLGAEIQQCDVVVVLIGREWLRAADDYGIRRLDSPDDFVRLEIETAFHHQIPVVPVLLGGVSMPPENALPDSLRSLVRINAAVLRSDPDYHVDSDRLVHGLEALVGSSIQAEREEVSQVPEFDPGTPGSVSVFVSHSTTDRPWVEQEVVRLLEAHGIRTWYAKESIKTASQWEREILRGMEACDWFLLVVSPRASLSEWIKDELNWAIFNRPTRVVPVIMEHCNLWDFHIRLPRLQHIDFTVGTDDVRQELVDMFRSAA